MSSKRKPGGVLESEAKKAALAHPPPPSTPVAATPSAPPPPTPEPRRPTAAQWAKLDARGRQTIERKFWLYRSRTWAGFEGIWKAARVLGAGTHGVAALFNKIGKADEYPEKIVVKQSGKPDPDLLSESHYMTRIKEAGKSNHFPDIYKTYYEESGTGTHKTRDPKFPVVQYIDGTLGIDPDKQVSRIMIEYCPGGNLWSYQEKHWSTSVPAENVLWTILACLARALVTLELGTDDPDDPPAMWDPPIAHLDMKPDNIFISVPDGQPHHNYAFYKLGDLGMAIGIHHDPSERR